MLGRSEVQDQQSASGIAVDLDELRPMVCEMEVVAEEHPARSLVDATGFWRPLQHQVPVRLEGYSAFNRVDDLSHLLDLVASNKDRRRGKQVRVRLHEARISAGFAETGLEATAQRVFVESDAMAVAIQNVPELPGRFGLGSGSRAHSRLIIVVGHASHLPRQR